MEEDDACLARGKLAEGTGYGVVQFPANGSRSVLVVIEEDDGVVTLPPAYRVGRKVFEALHVAVDVRQLTEQTLEVEHVVLVIARDHGGLDVGVAHSSLSFTANRVTPGHVNVLLTRPGGVSSLPLPRTQ